MKKYLYFLAGVMALGISSCKDDVEVYNPADDLERMPMTMFRKNHTTNISQSSDPYGTRVKDGTRNTIQLYWYGVDGAAGYEIRYGVEGSLTDGKEETWSDPSRLTDRFVVGPDVLHYEIENLPYKTSYRFSIRVLHPDGKEEHHSKWWGMGNGQEWEDQMSVETSERYTTPSVIFPSDKDFHSFNVYIDLEDKTAALTEAQRDTIHARFEVLDGKFVAHTLYLMPDAVNPDAAVPFTKYDIKQEDLDRGYIHITGLDENSTYVVRLRNNNIPVEVDSYYNDITLRTKGTPGEPIIIEHRITDKIYPDSTWNVGERKYNCMLLDTLITNFNNSAKLAEGQVFYLQGDKAYYFWNNVDLNKGFTLETDPADVALGKRATVYMAGIAPGQGSQDTKSCNFMFGKNLGAGEVDAPVQVENIIFRNIDFDVPEAQNSYHNLGGKGCGTGNYFANMYSTGRGVTFDKVEFENCSFQGFIRGFIRTQGSKVKKFNEMIVNNCVFYNCGYYQSNKAGYAWFNCELSSPENTMFNKFVFTNNTIYDSPMGAFLTHGSNSNYDSWADDLHYDITVRNNTFINFFTRSRQSYFSFRSFPGGSKIDFSRNLIVLAADENDERALEEGGADFRFIGGTGDGQFYFKDNYSAGCRDNHLKTNGIFSGSQLSATSNSFGKFQHCLFDCAKEDLEIKVGEEPLKSSELFNSPNPPHHQVSGVLHPDDHRAPADIWNALQYKNDLKVTTHEIYT
ncbi:MAG: hypothetical protein K2G05_02750, partial [Duncaniella sp.]|nr:hypothetical protein [Duncaniella sp.]